MPKKSRARKSLKQTQKQEPQKQEQRQNINIKIGELPTKKPRRRPRKGPSAPGREAPMRQLPPVVYQTLPQLTYYGKVDEFGTFRGEPKKTSIVEPTKPKSTILEDIGMVGTEGPVEIIDVPTKRETLSELITPVKPPMINVEKPHIELMNKLESRKKQFKGLIEVINDIPRRQVDPVEEGPYDIPRMQVAPPLEGLFDIPRVQVDPVEQPSIPPSFREQKATTITQPPMQQFPITQTELPMQSSGPPTTQKRKYTKSGKYSKKGQPEEQRPISPLSFEGSFGIGPKSVYAEPSTYSSTQNMFPSPMTERSVPTQFRSNTPEESTATTKAGRSDFSPMTERSLPTQFRSNTPEQGFITQKDVNQFFQPKKRNTSPKPKPKSENIIKGVGPVIKGRRSRAVI